MKIVKRVAKVLAGLLVLAGLFIGFKIANKQYTAYRENEQLNDTVLGIELTPGELEQGKRIANGKMLSKRLIDLSELAPLWKKISENDQLKEEFSYFDNLHFFAITYKSNELLVNGIVAEPKRGGKFPVIIFNRGGNKKVGTKGKFETLFSLLYSSAKLASEGYVIIAPCYREDDEFGGRDIHDVLNLTKTAEDLPKADAERLGLFGWSRGGMMTYLALKNSGLFKTAVVVNGPTDLSASIEERPEMEIVCASLIPNYITNKKEELEKRSVVHWADELNKNSSLLILCGTEDEQVNPDQAYQLAEKLTAINYEFTLKAFKTDHKFSGKTEELNALLVNWFSEKL